jgi:hypothetical protein
MLLRVLDYHLSTLYFRELQKHIPYDVGAAGMLVHKKLKDHDEVSAKCSSI